VSQNGSRLWGAAERENASAAFPESRRRLLDPAPIVKGSPDAPWDYSLLLRLVQFDGRLFSLLFVPQCLRASERGIGSCDRRIKWATAVLECMEFAPR